MTRTALLLACLKVNGTSLNAVAEAIGIPKSTLYRQLRTGKLHIATVDALAAVLGIPPNTLIKVFFPKYSAFLEGMGNEGATEDAGVG